MDIVLPSLGENISSAEVVSIRVKPGDAVGPETAVLEVETEKAAIEVPAGAAGVVSEILVKAGEKISVGQAVLRIGLTSKVEGPRSAEGREGGGAESAKAAEGTKKGPEGGKPKPSTANAGDRAEGKPPEAPTPSVPSTLDLGPKTLDPLPASPLVLRMAKEMGVDPARVPGTGEGGRVTADDLARFAKKRIEAAAAATPTLPDFSKWGPVRREPLSPTRRTVARNMAAIWTVPHVTQFDRADVTDLEAIRKSRNAAAPPSGARLTVTAFAVKAAALALRAHPRFNASVDLERGEWILKDYVSVGVAVDTPRGLLVPVLRDADLKSVPEIAAALAGIAAKAREGKIPLDDLRGGNLTVTNLGALGTTYFTPLINGTDVAVLGLGRAETAPVYAGEGFVPRLVLPLSLSYDHRVLDGAEAARFLRSIAEALEAPAALGMQGG